MYVNIAATAKAKQGRGYGSALIRVVNAKVSIYDQASGAAHPHTHEPCVLQSG